MKCTACGSDRMAERKTPQPHFFCAACLYRRKKQTPHIDYYGTLSGRSKMAKNDLEKKDRERVRFLKTYLHNGMRILELGCAEGSLGKAVKNSAKVIYCGVEPSKDRASARAGFEKVWTSLKNIPSKRRFDLISAFHVIEHIPDLKDTLNSVYRLLCDDGILVIEVPNYFGNRKLPWDFHKEHIHMFGPASIACLLERHGFFIKEIVSGHYESVLYNDSIRIAAYKRTDPAKLKRDLIDRFRRLLGSRFVVYGAGGDFEALVAPYIRSSDLVAIIDSSRSRIGNKLLNNWTYRNNSYIHYRTLTFKKPIFFYQKSLNIL